MQDKCPYLILYEDEEILTVYKKRNVFTVATEDKKTFTHNLFHYLKLYVAKKKENLYLVHRLDYETSGILIFAKTIEMQRWLKKQFELRQVERDYEAVIEEKVPLGKEYMVRQYLSEGKKIEITGPEEGREAITKIETHNYIQIGTALKISLETGRRNQIRLAIHSLGFTLLGDNRYSHSQAKRMYLNAYKLSFPNDGSLKKSTFETAPLWLVD